ncbi:hypothetical protein KBK19_16965 [Microvirga sp. STR05]|uniref:Uncharacterized protein n=1 Tax=Hymenobacter duratus TaxID=2771356 RepID=A0ABR8JQA4_9BACT|nr:hypothetical protein [Hymenobacter duratus]MBD2716739.1 hypothetical protein [Hymenobacter duratus]MBR7951654.1 hypothetical protein [Microvirga sp. STR05]
MATATKTPQTASAATVTPATSVAPLTPSRAYLTATVDEATGEVTESSRFRYLPGHPKQIRADLKAGVFNVNGEKVLGKTLSFIPMALRIFSDNILNMGRKVWAELFFVDEIGAVCAVLFHGYSVENLQKLNASLFYDDLKLTDVLLTVTPQKKQTEKDGKPATYFIAEFSYIPADLAEVQARQEFTQDHDIYRAETMTNTAELRICQGYRLPARYTEPQPAELEAAPAAKAAALAA